MCKLFAAVTADNSLTGDPLDLALAGNVPRPRTSPPTAPLHVVPKAPLPGFARARPARPGCGVVAQPRVWGALALYVLHVELCEPLGEQPAAPPAYVLTWEEELQEARRQKQERLAAHMAAHPMPVKVEGCPGCRSRRRFVSA